MDQFPFLQFDAATIIRGLAVTDSVTDSVTKIPLDSLFLMNLHTQQFPITTAKSLIINIRRAGDVQKVGNLPSAHHAAVK